jgi:hypothetical protein
MKLDTKASPGELAKIAQVASEIQRIQRLCLGMTTENMGLGATPPGQEPEGGSHVEKEGKDSPPTGMPTFIVEMSRGGKFQRVRPRLTLDAAAVIEETKQANG